MVTLLIDLMRSSVTKHATFNVSAPYDPGLPCHCLCQCASLTFHCLCTTFRYTLQPGGQAYVPFDIPAVPVTTGSPPLMMYVTPQSVWATTLHDKIAVCIVCVSVLYCAVCEYDCAVTCFLNLSSLCRYVMPHFVGNHPASWRRQFYGDIAHGVKIFE